MYTTSSTTKCMFYIQQSFSTQMFSVCVCVGFHSQCVVYQCLIVQKNLLPQFTTKKKRKKKERKCSTKEAVICFLSWERVALKWLFSELSGTSALLSFHSSRNVIRLLLFRKSDLWWTEHSRIFCPPPPAPPSPPLQSTSDCRVINTTVPAKAMTVGSSARAGCPHYAPFWVFCWCE